MSGAPTEKPPAQDTLLTRGAGALGLRRNVVLLLGMIVLIGLGERMWQRFLPMYLVELGAGPLAVGLCGFMENALSAGYALVGGYATDRLGHRRSLVIFAAMNLVGYAMLAVHSWPVALGSMFFSYAWTRLALPAMFSLVGAELPKNKRVMGLAVQGIINRIPHAAGPVIGGAVFAAMGVVAGMPYILALAAGLTILAVWIQLRHSSASPPAAGHEELHPLDLWRAFRPELRRLLVSDILIRFCEQIPYAFVVLWVTERLRRSTLEFGWLTAIEMSTAAALYIPVALWADRRGDASEAAGRGHQPVTERRPFVITTFVFFTAFPVALYFTAGWWGLVGAFVVRGLKEFGEPSRKAMIVDLAREGMKARTIGLYYLLRDSITALAALAGGALWKIDPALNLWTAAGFGVLGTIVYAVASRPASARPS